MSKLEAVLLKLGVKLHKSLQNLKNAKIILCPGDALIPEEAEVGTAYIAKQLNCSRRTVLKFFKADLLPGYAYMRPSRVRNLEKGLAGAEYSFDKDVIQPYIKNVAKMMLGHSTKSTPIMLPAIDTDYCSTPGQETLFPKDKHTLPVLELGNISKKGPEEMQADINALVSSMVKGIKAHKAGETFTPDYVDLPKFAKKASSTIIKTITKTVYNSYIQGTLQSKELETRLVKLIYTRFTDVAYYRGKRRPFPTEDEVSFNLSLSKVEVKKGKRKYMEFPAAYLWSSTKRWKGLDSVDTKSV